MRQLDGQERMLMVAMLELKRLNNPTKERLTAAIYARKSSEDIHQTSIETQIKDCERFITENNDLFALDKRHIYKDEAKSGMFQDNRTEFQLLMNEARSGNIDVIVLYHHERLTRKIGDFDQIKSELEKCKVFLVFGDVYYENTAMGEFYANLSFAMSQLEARTAASKTARTLHLRAENGKSAGGRAPYGLKCVGKQFDIEKSEAPAVKMLFEMVAKKQSYEKIIEELTANGFRTRAGKKFSYSTLSDMLRNWKYAGIYVYCRKDKAGNPINRKKRRVLLGEQEEVRNDMTVVNAIVSKKLFLEVQQILDNRELGATKQNARGEYILSGLVRCECGHGMFGEKNKGERGKKIYRYYECPAHRKKRGCDVYKVDADYLETAVKKVVYREVQTFLKAGNLSKEILSEKRKEYQSKIGTLSRKMKDIERENGKMAKKMLDVQESVAKTLERTIESNAELLKSLQAKTESLQKTVAIIDSLGDGLSFGEKQLFADMETTRKLIRAFVKAIVISKDTVQIQFHN